MRQSALPPSTVDDILATAIPDPSFTDAFKKKGSPPGFPGLDVATLKGIVQTHLSNIQQKLKANRPEGVMETEHTIHLDTGFDSRILICRPASIAGTSPIAVLFHGGGYCLAFPETELELAREIVKSHSAIVACPSVRLAPEHPFPVPMEDAWAVIKYIAAELISPHTPSAPLFPPQADPSTGFIVGGTSSGAHTAAVVAHIARDNGLSPPLTGQFLSAGGFIDPSRVPEKYRPFYLSYEQNKQSPMLNREFLLAFRAVLKPDPDSSLWAPLDQHHSDDGPGEVKQGHMGQPPAYFQVCGMDLSRDDSLIYERVLREECGVQTRVDLYSGFPHCWWNEYPELEMSKTRMKDSVNGFGWLLSQTKR